MDSITHTAAKAGGQAELTLATAQVPDPDGLVYLSKAGANLVTITAQAPTPIACTWPHCPGDHIGSGVSKAAMLPGGWDSIAVLFAVVIVASITVAHRLLTRFSDAPAAPAAPAGGRHSGRADLGLLLRVTMLVALALMWWGLGIVFIAMTRLTDLLPRAELLALLGAFGVSYGAAALWVLAVIRRAEQRRADVERRLGGAWVHAMARKVRS